MCLLPINMLSSVWLLLMLSKRSLGCDLHSVAPAKRFRLNVSDLFLSGDVSGKRMQSVIDDAHKARTRNVADMTSNGIHTNNHHRDLLRKMLKKNRWSPIYYAQVRVVNPKTHVEYLDWVPMLLPHEIIKCLHARNGDKILARDSMDPLDLQHMADVERKMNARVGSLLG